MRRETLHLTLAFVGDVAPDRLAELCEIAGTVCVPAFDLLFDRGQCLARKRIFWATAGTIPAELRDLATGLSERLGSAAFRTEDRPFAAHVTLLRHANCAVAPGDDPWIEWSVRDFVLVESELKPEGSSYRIVGRWSLRTGS